MAGSQRAQAVSQAPTEVEAAAAPVLRWCWMEEEKARREAMEVGAWSYLELFMECCVACLVIIIPTVVDYYR